MPVGRITRPAALGVLAASLIALATLAVPALEGKADGPGRRIVVEHTAPPAPAVATQR
jgi:hypothetical protein